MTKAARVALVMVLLTSAFVASQRSTDQERVWSLEEAYWQNVQANDFERYRALWHTDFLGWPNSSPTPVRKAQITDWITAHSRKGDTLKSYDLEKCIVQVTADLATTTYRVRLIWLAKNGETDSEKVRIIHTWRRSPTGDWHIVSGMSAPTDADGH